MGKADKFHGRQARRLTETGKFISVVMCSQTISGLDNQAPALGRSVSKNRVFQG